MKPRDRISSFEWILVGFILHVIGGTFAVSSKLICYTLCGIGLIIIFFNFFFNQKRFVRPFKGIIRRLYYLYLLWLILILIRPFFNNNPIDGFSPVDRYQWLSFLVPFFVFFGIKNINIKHIFSIGYFSGIIGILFLIFYFEDIYLSPIPLGFEEYQEYIGIVGIPTYFLAINSFLIFFYPYTKIKYKVFIFISFGIVVFNMIISARRGGVVSFALLLLFTFFLYVFHSGKGSKFLKLLSVFGAILLLISIYFLYADTTFALLISRLDEDSRSGVEWYMLKSFRDQPFDWLFGRGLNGTYFCPLFENENNQRGIIETGYLFLILKGGIINLCFFLFFLLHSFLKGLFNSNNMLIKGMSLYLLAHVIFLVPFGVPSFDIEYLLVWVFILFCQSREWRLKSDEEIKSLLIHSRK